MSYDVEHLGIGDCNLSDFFTDLKGQLSLAYGIRPIPEGLSLEAVRRPLLVIGKPGIGKTCGIQSIIDDLNTLMPNGEKIKLKKILLGQTVVGELSGIDIVNPSNGDLKKSQSPSLPREDKDGKYGVLFLDEITTADEAQIQPALGLADDSRCIGEYTLPEHWVVVAAGNGPDCANFVKMDDMTLTRFQAYNINYDYKKDWRPWAHKNGINPLIIAYLNFEPTEIVNVVSNEMDKAGKMFACPRTWTRLSDELKIREATGRAVKQNELYSFASRIIGEESARKFAAFAAFRSDVTFDAEKIVEGKESLPTQQLPTEVFHIILQSITKCLSVVMKNGTDTNGDFFEEVYIKVGNAFRWILALEDCHMLNSVVDAFVELRDEIPGMGSIFADPDFIPYCPEYDAFIDNHAEALARALD